MDFPSELYQKDRKKLPLHRIKFRNFMYSRHKPDSQWQRGDDYPDFNQIKADQSLNWSAFSIPIWVRFNNQREYLYDYGVVGYPVKAILNISDETNKKKLVSLKHEPDPNNYSHCEITPALGPEMDKATKRLLRLRLKQNCKVFYKPDESQDEHVCECCKPNVSFSNGRLVIGFRNWLMGSRDIYYTVSQDTGKTFTAPKKSGTGTWQLNSCPMDGGGLSVSENGKVSTAWRRDNDVYYWSESQAEQKVGSGRDVSMSQNKANTVIAWQENNSIKVMNLTNRKISDIGKGISPKVYLLDNGKAICAWEDNKVVRYKVI
jgi:hypothetical protein